MLRALSLCTCCRQYPGAAIGRRLRSSHPVVSAFPEIAVGSACTSSFSRIARRSLALRPAHSRRHLYVTSHTEGFSDFVTSMTAPVASGWSGWPDGACTRWKAPAFPRRTQIAVIADGVATWVAAASVSGGFVASSAARARAASRSASLGPNEQREVAALRHARYFAQVLGSAGDLFQTGGDALQESLALFDRERTNIIVGQRCAAAGTDASIEPAQLASRYTGAVSLVLNLRLHPRERIAWAEAALAANRRIGNRPGEGSALTDLGQAYADLGQTGKAIECYEQVLVIGRQ